MHYCCYICNDEAVYEQMATQLQEGYCLLANIDNETELRKLWQLRNSVRAYDDVHDKLYYR